MRDRVAQKKYREELKREIKAIVQEEIKTILEHPNFKFPVRVVGTPAITYADTVWRGNNY